MSRHFMWVCVTIGVFLWGCEAKPGERCDSFFKNTCQSPSTCVEVDDAKYCAVSCDMDPDNPGQKMCKDPNHRMVEVMAEMGGKSVPMGCNCVPK